MPGGEVGAFLDTAAEVPSGTMLSVDEIDDDRTDTFRLFVSDETEAGATPEDFRMLCRPDDDRCCYSA
jgi:hypothetical protein